MTKFIIVSFSLGLDSAIIKVIATIILSLITFSPFINKLSFLSKKYKKIAAAMRLFPSENEWFFITKYSKLAAFSSKDG